MNSVTDTQLVFRPALASEADLLSRLAFASKAYWPYSASQLERWAPELRVMPEDMTRWPTVVALKGPRQAGFYQLRRLSEQVCRIEHFWVAPEYMREGIGRSMLADAVDRSTRLGTTVLRIESDPNAESFYLAVGARRVGEVPAPIDGAPERVLPVLEIALD